MFAFSVYGRVPCSPACPCSRTTLIESYAGNRHLLQIPPPHLRRSQPIGRVACPLIDVSRSRDEESRKPGCMYPCVS